MNNSADYLTKNALLNHETAQAAATAATQKKMTLVQYLVKEGILTSDTILQSATRHFGIPIFDLTDFNNDKLKSPLIHIDLMVKYHIILLDHTAEYLHIGIADPDNLSIIPAIEFHTGLRTKIFLVDESKLNAILTKSSTFGLLHNQLETALERITPIEENVSQYEISDKEDEPISNFVHHLITEGINNKISDIHIEPYADSCRIRFRKDSLLYKAATIPLHLANRIMTRLKIMSQLNIAERRLPQDGHLSYHHDPMRDIRINTCPTLHGEKIVLRILNSDNRKLDLKTLGFSDCQIDILFSALSRPQGLILVTGPTGSGKTITLYSALNHLNSIEKNISTIEDPVEIELVGINQININPKIGLTFSNILRSLLRQDPDIIMVGEIRDLETGNMAMQAAQTGHLVLSSLHSNSALDTITRLQAMGLETQHLIHTISLIIAQRLVRKLCNRCKTLASNEELSFPEYQPVGCDYCHQGYHGRIGIYEVIPMSAELSKLICTVASMPDLIQLTKTQQWPLLWESGLENVKLGHTNFAEIKRVINQGD